MKWTITCKEATRFISMKEERKLSFKQRIQLIMHMGVCSLCKLFYKQNKIITQQAARLDKHINATLSQPEKEEIIKRINAE